MTRNFTAALFWVLLGVGAAHCPIAAANTIYTYTGNPFGQFTDDISPACGSCDTTVIPGSYDATMRISGYFEVASPLGSNFLGQVSAISFSFQDGRQTITNSTPDLRGDSRIDIQTDATGNVIYWQITAVVDHGSSYSDIHGFAVPVDNYFPGAVSALSFDGAEISSGPNAFFSHDTAGNRDNPGTWSVASTPEPTALALIAIGLVGFVLGRRRQT